jgi:sugar phosphate isomerase/epimerase
MSRSLKLIVAIAALPVVTFVGMSHAAQDTPPKPWPEVKCERYTKAWSEALARRGTRGLGREFIERHEAFLASGCTIKADVCPRSGEELDLANMMVVAAMNAGTASTFPPFACRQ